MKLEDGCNKYFGNLVLGRKSNTSLVRAFVSKGCKGLRKRSHLMRDGTADLQLSRWTFQYTRIAAEQAQIRREGRYKDMLAVQGDSPRNTAAEEYWSVCKKGNDKRVI